jgi:hypothetical protein
MKTYNVHIYREMRLSYPGIEAESHEAAAQIAVDKCSNEAETLEDCEGEDLAALVDVEGDAEYKQSKTIDFMPTLLRNHAEDMLGAIDTLIGKADDLISAIDGTTDHFEAEVAALSEAASTAEKVALKARGQA